MTSNGEGEGSSGHKCRASLREYIIIIIYNIYVLSIALSRARASASFPSTDSRAYTRMRVRYATYTRAHVLRQTTYISTETFICTLDIRVTARKGFARQSMNTDTLHTLIALLQGMLPSDGTNGVKAPMTNVDTVSTVSASTSVLTNIANALRVSKANIGNLEKALLSAYNGATRRDIEANKTSPHYVSRTVGKWISNAGGYKAFCEHAQSLYGATVPVTPVTVTPMSPTPKAKTYSVPALTTGTDVLNMCNTYFHSRQTAGTGFCTQMTLVGIGTYKGNTVGIVKKGETDILYAVGDLFNTGVKANRGKKLVGEVVNDTSYANIQPQAVFVPAK